MPAAAGPRLKPLQRPHTLCIRRRGVHEERDGLLTEGIREGQRQVERSGTNIHSSLSRFGKRGELAVTSSAI